MPGTFRYHARWPRTYRALEKGGIHIGFVLEPKLWLYERYRFCRTNGPLRHGTAKRTFSPLQKIDKEN